MRFLHLELKQAVLSRQREYKLAAIQAKQSGDIDQAKQHYLTAKVTSVTSTTWMNLFVCEFRLKPFLMEFSSLHAEAGQSGGGIGQRQTSGPELPAASSWSVRPVGQFASLASVVICIYITIFKVCSTPFSFLVSPGSNTSH